VVGDGGGGQRRSNQGLRYGVAKRRATKMGRRATPGVVLRPAYLKAGPQLDGRSSDVGRVAKPCRDAREVEGVVEASARENR